MIFSRLRTQSTSQSGFTLIEVLVAAVIFVGVFLLLFTLLGRVLSSSSGADQLRVAAIADLELARFHEGTENYNVPQFVELDGIRYRVDEKTETDDFRTILRLTISRVNSNEILATLYGIRYVGED